jgi:hypothetical protein
MNFCSVELWGSRHDTSEPRQSCHARAPKCLMHPVAGHLGHRVACLWIQRGNQQGKGDGCT